MNRWQDAVALRARVLVLLCAAGLLLPWLARRFAEFEGRLPWLLDLGAHWQWLYAAVLLLCGALAALRQPHWLLALPFAALPWFSAAPGAPASTAAAAPTLAIAIANVQHDNPQPQLLLDWLAATDPDLVIVLEASTALAPTLAALPDYPHQQIEPADDPFGIALLSRFPLTAVAVQHDEFGIARIEAQLEWQGQCMDLVAWHPMPPLSPVYRQARDRRLQSLAAGVDGRPRIVAGDLNASPWSSAFAGLDDLGLRRASGLAPTWPSAGRGVIGIPIDQVLVSRHWAVRASERGPDIGSDHYPLRVELVLDADAKGAACTP
ncbi:MAG: endonuclease/exonuclease/phosphatase family protein [Xanthomonadales bacterium]|nr:endonuclease/exonuclease/phosphatase family protein [Xanthomonadales bacterium]MCC6562594.1 endonuclease/exonuclease/phosphatase family protein [Xanthomonadales bacterium]